MDEYEACGVSIQGRVTRFVQALETLRRLWSEDSVTFDAKAWSLHEARMLPKPKQKDGIPILIASFQENALRRTAKLGNGWIGGGLMSPEKFRLGLEKVESAAHDFGRDPSELEIAKVTYFCVDPDTDKSQKEMQKWLSGYYGTETGRFFGSLSATDVGVFGTPKQCAEKLRKLVDVGVETFILSPLRPDLEQLEILAKDVIPQVS
jgi:alkanesulfonate monooxygenase